MNQGTPWANMDPQLDSKMDPASLFLGGHCPKNALQVPSKVHIGNFFVDLYTTEKHKFTAWFEVNPRFGSRHQAF